MIYEKYQVARIYGEMERRISLMLMQHEIETETELKDTICLMRQGIYVALMATAFNWDEVAAWCQELER